MNGWMNKQMNEKYMCKVDERIETSQMTVAF